MGVSFCLDIVYNLDSTDKTGDIEMADKNQDSMATILISYFRKGDMSVDDMLHKAHLLCRQVDDNKHIVTYFFWDESVLLYNKMDKKLTAYYIL